MIDPMCNRLSPDFLPMWTRLRGHGHLWHRTSLQSLTGILTDGKIVPNSGQFATTFGQSKVSYSRHLGAVSLFDFDTYDENDIFDHEWKWSAVLTGRLPAGVLIRIRRGGLRRNDLLLPSDIWRGDPRLDRLPEKIKRGRMVIPAVEALHIGPIPASTFDGFILTAFGDIGGILMFETGSDTEALRILTETSAKWEAAAATRTSERHARGEYTLAELLDQASLSNNR